MIRTLTIAVAFALSTASIAGGVHAGAGVRASGSMRATMHPLPTSSATASATTGARFQQMDFSSRIHARDDTRIDTNSRPVLGKGDTSGDVESDGWHNTVHPIPAGKGNPKFRCGSAGEPRCNRTP